MPEYLSCVFVYKLQANWSFFKSESDTAGKQEFLSKTRDVGFRWDKKSADTGNEPNLKVARRATCFNLRFPIMALQRRIIKKTTAAGAAESEAEDEETLEGRPVI